MSTHDPNDGSGDKPFPSPEEIQRKLGDFLRSNFGDRVSFSTFTEPTTADGQPPAPEPTADPAPVPTPVAVAPLPTPEAAPFNPNKTILPGAPVITEPSPVPVIPLGNPVQQSATVVVSPPFFGTQTNSLPNNSLPNNGGTSV